MGRVVLEKVKALDFQVRNTISLRETSDMILFTLYKDHYGCYIGHLPRVDKPLE